MEVNVNVVARSSSGESASFLRRVVVKNVAGVVSLVGSVETVGVDQKDAGAAAWAVAITADDANDASAVTVTGAAGVNIRWHAVVQGSEVVY